MICGSSAGALVAALVGCQTDEELPDLFEPGALDFSAFRKRPEKGRFRRRLQRFLKHGVIMDIKVVEQAMHDNIGDVTFLEAYQRTGRLLNIILKPGGGVDSPQLLNYLNAPDVLIWTAACAAISLPGLYERVELLAKNTKGEISKWSQGVTWAGTKENGSDPPPPFSFFIFSFFQKERGLRPFIVVCFFPATSR